MQIFFTSDWHFSHDNIIKYCKRPFKDKDEMNTELVKRYNSLVGPDDLVYFLGDACFGGPSTPPTWLPLLNGKKILVVGNHDLIDRLHPYFDEIYYYLEPTIVLDNGKKQKFILSHYPFASWNGMGKGFIHLHGHCHGSLEGKDNFKHRIDVGVDSWDFYPVPLATIIERTKNWDTYKKVDHH